MARSVCLITPEVLGSSLSMDSPVQREGHAGAESEHGYNWLLR
jgi:hypothetical protein